MPTFTPPTVDDLPALLPTTRGPARDLWKWHGGHARGRTVLKEGGAYSTVDAFAETQARLTAADFVYLGGHVYEVSAAEAAALTAAGYTVSSVPAPGAALYPAVDLYPSSSLYPAA